MEDVYKNCPEFEDENYFLRMVCMEDKKDLLKVYFDKAALRFFNSDNCGNNDFYYTTERRMGQAIEYWLYEYNRKGFVRWAVVSKPIHEVIGTIELFHRDADDYFTNCGLLKLDIRSDYEKTSEIIEILRLIIKPAFTLFQCNKIATKAVVTATQRVQALEDLGFLYTDEKLIGHDGTLYSSYFVLHQEK